MTHNEPELAWYYYWGFETPELMWLCRECARELGDKVQFVRTDNLHEPCWRCVEMEHLADIEEEKLWRELEQSEVWQELYYEEQYHSSYEEEY